MKLRNLLSQLNQEEVSQPRLKWKVKEILRRKWEEANSDKRAKYSLNVCRTDGERGGMEGCYYCEMNPVGTNKLYATHSKASNAAREKPLA